MTIDTGINQQPFRRKVRPGRSSEVQSVASCVQYYQEYRRMIPFLEKRPSEYMREQMWFATQPIEEPDNPQHMIETIHHIGDDNVIFASDWPHHDFDHPRGITKLPMGNELKAKIMGLNALNAFTRIPAPVLAAD